MSGAHRTIAVALHDIEPATFERCALIRDWLDDHGVDHATLLVIPARDLHPLAERSLAPSLDASAQDSSAQDRQLSARDLLGPPIALSSTGRLRRVLSPVLLRAGALLSRTTLRLDLHPSDLDDPSHMLALEWVLKRSTHTREAVTYEQLAFAAAR